MPPLDMTLSPMELLQQRALAGAGGDPGNPVIPGAPAAPSGPVPSSAPPAAAAPAPAPTGGPPAAGGGAGATASALGSGLGTAMSNAISGAGLFGTSAGDMGAPDIAGITPGDRQRANMQSIMKVGMMLIAAGSRQSDDSRAKILAAMPAALDNGANDLNSFAKNRLEMAKLRLLERTELNKQSAGAQIMQSIGMPDPGTGTAVPKTTTATGIPLPGAVQPVTAAPLAPATGAQAAPAPQDPAAPAPAATPGAEDKRYKYLLQAVQKDPNGEAFNYLQPEDRANEAVWKNPDGSRKTVSQVAQGLNLAPAAAPGAPAPAGGGGATPAPVPARLTEPAPILQPGARVAPQGLTVGQPPAPNPGAWKPNRTDQAILTGYRLNNEPDKMAIYIKQEQDKWANRRLATQPYINPEANAIMQDHYENGVYVGAQKINDLPKTMKLVPGNNGSTIAATHDSAGRLQDVKEIRDPNRDAESKQIIQDVSKRHEEINKTYNDVILPAKQSYERAVDMEDKVRNNQTFTGSAATIRQNAVRMLGTFGMVTKADLDQLVNTNRIKATLGAEAGKFAKENYGPQVSDQDRENAKQLLGALDNGTQAEIADAVARVREEQQRKIEIYNRTVGDHNSRLEGAGLANANYFKAKPFTEIDFAAEKPWEKRARENPQPEPATVTPRGAYQGAEPTRPQNIDATTWQHMTPQERALFAPRGR